MGESVGWSDSGLFFAVITQGGRSYNNTEMRFKEGWGCRGARWRAAQAFIILTFLQGARLPNHIRDIHKFLCNALRNRVGDHIHHCGPAALSESTSPSSIFVSIHPPPSPTLCLFAGLPPLFLSHRNSSKFSFFCERERSYVASFFFFLFLFLMLF
jgi:hypothetical protein